MSAIANNSMKVFPDFNDVWTVVVKSNIQGGGQFHLSCIKYVFVDPKIQTLGCTWEQVKKMLVNVGFNFDGKAKPDHTISTLMDGCHIKLALACIMLQQGRMTATETPILWTRLWSGSQDSSAPDLVRPPAWMMGRRAAPAW